MNKKINNNARPYKFILANMCITYYNYIPLHVTEMFSGFTHHYMQLIVLLQDYHKNVINLSLRSKVS